MKHPPFITFEGTEGSGKSTQVKLFVQWLRKRGHKVAVFHEPGATRIGEKIRKLLLSKNYPEMDITTEIFLFLAARAQLVREKIKPALNSGKIVVCDRYSDATVAYQCYGGGIKIKDIKNALHLAEYGLKPDLTFLLDIGIRKGLKRAGRKDRIEEKGEHFHRRVKDGYRKLAQRNKERIYIIPVSSHIEKTQAKIQKIFLSKFPSL